MTDIPSHPNRPKSQPPLELLAAPTGSEARHAGGSSMRGFTASETPNESGNLSGYLHAMRRCWLMALVIGLPLAAIAAGAVWQYWPQTYTATAVLRLAPSEKTLIFETADVSRINNNTFEIYKRTQRQLLRSRFVITPALRDESLRNLSIIQEHQSDPEGWLGANIAVSFPDESEIMQVSLTDRNKVGLHQLVNGVVESYFQEVVYEEQKRKRERLNDLEVVYGKFESALRSKRTELKQLMDRLGTGDSTGLTLEQQTTVLQYSALKQQLSKVQLELMQGELTQPETPQDVPDEALVSQEEVQLAMQTDSKALQLGAQKQQILNSMQLFGQRLNSDVAAPKLDDLKRRLEVCDRNLEARQHELRPEIVESKRQAIATWTGSQQQKNNLLRLQEKQIEKKLQELKVEDPGTSSVSRSSTDVEMMRMDVAGLQDVVSRLAAEIERTKVELQPDAKTQSNRVVLLSKADPALAGDPKSRLTKAMAAGVMTLMLPLVLLVWLDAQKGCIHSGAEIVQGLGLSLVGAVPMIPQRVLRRLGDHSVKGRYWRTLLSESVDTIAAVLLRGAKAGKLRVIMVSSATDGEGKTTLAGNLAKSLAGAGCRTALVDFDLRRPALHRVFDLALEPGAYDVLRDRTEFESVLQATHIPNLTLMTAGRSQVMGLSGLATADLKALFDRLRENFEFIVVDGSPILPVVDTRLIAQHADSVLISVLRDVSRVRQVRAACERLATFAVPVFGVVLTGSKGDAYPASNYERPAYSKAV